MFNPITDNNTFEAPNCSEGVKRIAGQSDAGLPNVIPLKKRVTNVKGGVSKSGGSKPSERTLVPGDVAAARESRAGGTIKGTSSSKAAQKGKFEKKGHREFKSASSTNPHDTKQKRNREATDFVRSELRAIFKTKILGRFDYSVQPPSGWATMVDLCSQRRAEYMGEEVFDNPGVRGNAHFFVLSQASHLFWYDIKSMAEASLQVHTVSPLELFKWFSRTFEVAIQLYDLSTKERMRFGAARAKHVISLLSSVDMSDYLYVCVMPIRVKFDLLFAEQVVDLTRRAKPAFCSKQEVSTSKDVLASADHVTSKSESHQTDSTNGEIDFALIFKSHDESSDEGDGPEKSDEQAPSSVISGAAEILSSQRSNSGGDSPDSVDRTVSEGIEKIKTAELLSAHDNLVREVVGGLKLLNEGTVVNPDSKTQITPPLLQSVSELKTPSSFYAARYSQEFIDMDSEWIRWKRLLFTDNRWVSTLFFVITPILCFMLCMMSVYNTFAVEGRLYARLAGAVPPRVILLIMAFPGPLGEMLNLSWVILGLVWVELLIIISMGSLHTLLVVGYIMSFDGELTAVASQKFRKSKTVGNTWTFVKRLPWVKGDKRVKRHMLGDSAEDPELAIYRFETKEPIMVNNSFFLQFWKFICWIECIFLTHLLPVSKIVKLADDTRHSGFSLISHSRVKVEELIISTRAFADAISLHSCHTKMSRSEKQKLISRSLDRMAHIGLDRDYCLYENQFIIENTERAITQWLASREDEPFEGCHSDFQ